MSDHNGKDINDGPTQDNEPDEGPNPEPEQQQDQEATPIHDGRDIIIEDDLRQAYSQAQSTIAAAQIIARTATEIGQNAHVRITEIWREAARRYGLELDKYEYDLNLFTGKLARLGPKRRPQPQQPGPQKPGIIMPGLPGAPKG